MCTGLGSREDSDASVPLGAVEVLPDAAAWLAEVREAAGASAAAGRHCGDVDWPPGLSEPTGSLRLARPRQAVAVVVIAVVARQVLWVIGPTCPDVGFADPAHCWRNRVFARLDVCDAKTMTSSS